MLTDCDDPGLFLKNRKPYGVAFPLLRVIAVVLVGVSVVVGVIGVGVHVWEAQVKAEFSVPLR